MPSPIDRVDLVILGGGLAGLSAGNRARQLGLSATIVEQGDGPQYPCNSRFSGGILHLAFQNVKDDPARILAAMHEANGGYGDAAVLERLAYTSGRAVDWLRDEGTQFIRVGEIIWQQWMFAPPRPLTPGLDWNGRGPDVTLRRLYDNFRSRGGKVVHRATGVELIEDAGACRGLVVEVDGLRQTIDARAVLIADGGFQADLELLRNISPAPERLLQRGAANARGAGLRMAQMLGADVSDLSTFYGHLQSRDALVNPKLWPYPQLDELATSGIVVTGDGERFTDEGLGGVNIANRIARRSDPLDCFVIFDAHIWNTAGRGARIPANPHLVSAGARLVQGDTIAALAMWTAIDAEVLQRSVDRYNAAVADGNPVALVPPRTTAKYRPMRIATAPFYALPICVGITHTTGGLLIDEHARVRRRGGGTIAGLYAAGSATGGIEGGPNAGYIGGLMKALVFGLVAAEHMATGATARPPVETKRANAYPAVRWLVKHGHHLAIGLALLPLLAAIALGVTGHWIWSLVALGASPVVYLLMKSYTELVTLMSDMLIPKQEE